MSDTVIELNHVSKLYRLRRGWYVSSLKDEVGRLTARLLGRRVEPREDFWALKDVSFSLERGDVLGMVGANGAGKSTLLKIISQVTVPTSGSFVARGRLGALIEVGAGFHPELTGRENIFLNGSIMGMSRREIQSKFDMIVAFAEIEQFIDTPVKFYSSGMQMRLGFSVAAHTDPDILLIDEILAVGDASFQAKCLNKLAELKQQEKTVILVTHNLSNIREHAKTVVWIDHGQVRMIGAPDDVVDAYLEYVTASMTAEAAGTLADSGWVSREVVVLGVETCDRHDRPQVRFDRDDVVCIDIAYQATAPVPGAVFGVSILDAHGYPLGGVVTDPDSVKITTGADRAILRLTLDPLVLNKGTYRLNVYVLDPTLKKYYDFKRAVATLVVDGPKATAPDTTGYIYYPHQWEQLK
jgi:ABC-type polysaccharide/polyol phosphate transport system ATPase subunit